MVEFTGTEQAYLAVLAVVSGVLADLAPAQPADRLGRRRSADTGQIVRGHLLEDGEFCPERGDSRSLTALALLLFGLTERISLIISASGTRLLKSAAPSGRKPCGRSASSATRCRTPTVTGL